MTKSTLIAAAALTLVAFAYTQNHAEEPAKPGAKKEQPMEEATPSSPAASPLQRAGADENDPDAPNADPEKIDWSKINWRKRLTRDEFDIMRRAGTERAFTGEYWDFFEDGAYKCRGCGLPLFESDAKFDAHCGWPSFDQTLAKDAVVEIEDNTHGMHRVEVRCRRCNAHLGHVFDDGPTATGLRYCMNSASIKFVPDEELPQASPLQRAGEPEKTPTPPKKQ